MHIMLEEDIDHLIEERIFGNEVCSADGDDCDGDVSDDACDDGDADAGDTTDNETLIEGPSDKQCQCWCQYF